ncbi:biliverdin-producing heme oxygenase [Myxococcota bacterium]|nr:biliverdin-producing heme oxygenase [Myxococcota bacterium]
MIVERIRAETRADHTRIEAVIDLTAPDLTRARYVRFLERMFGYFEPVEARLAAISGWEPTGLDPRARARAFALISDLTALGHDPERIARLPRASALPDVSSLARALGCLYVLEGSRLGGRVLTRTLAPRLGLTPEHGLGFLGGTIGDTPASWPALVDALERWAATHTECEDDVVRAARETYATLTAWHLDGATSGGER